LKKWFLLSLSVFLLNCAGTEPEEENILRSDPLRGFVIAGYLPEYRLSTINTRIAQYLSDVIYFSIEPAEEGELDLSRISNNAFYVLKQFRSVNTNIRILLAVGGWGRSDGFSTMAMNDSNRAAFIRNLTDYCLAKNFNGADYDWEFPANTIQNQSYEKLIIETKQSFAGHDLIVTAALSSGQRLSSNAYAALDRIHLMSYDHGSRHATYEDAVQDVQNFLDHQVPSGKIALGIPFYGRGITNFALEMAYAEIMQNYHPAPDQDEVNGVYFNGIETVKRKTLMALQDSLQGVMVWDLGQDTVDETSLLKSIYQVVIESY
jgi:GH18 family chitinase